MVFAIPFNLVFYDCVRNNLSPTGSLGMDGAAFLFFPVGKSKERQRERDAVAGNSTALSLHQWNVELGSPYSTWDRGGLRRKMGLYWKPGWQEWELLCNHNIQLLKVKCLKIINFEARTTVFFSFRPVVVNGYIQDGNFSVSFQFALEGERQIPFVSDNFGFLKKEPELAGRYKIKSPISHITNLSKIQH